jgi:hypothetical protein
MNSTKKTARLAGLRYLVNDVTGLYISSKLIVPGNAASTANTRWGQQDACFADGDPGIAALAVFDKRQLEAMSMLFLDLHRHGYVVGSILGLWLFHFGVLVFRSVPSDASWASC